MTIAQSTTAAGNTWTNVLDAQTIFDFQFGSTKPPEVSLDGRSVTYTFGLAEIIFRSTGQLTLNPPTGTVTEFETPIAFYSGFSFELATFLNAARDGDIDGLNKLLWVGRDTINGGAGDDPPPAGATAVPDDPTTHCPPPQSPPHGRGARRPVVH